MHDLSLRPVLGDDLEEIVRGNVEDLDKSPLNPFRDCSSMLQRSATWDSNPYEWH
jgi:hypothetical protein